MNLSPWDPSRLRVSNYIDAMAMIRAEALRQVGGYTTELELYGWEDYDLWCRMAECGMRGAYVREMLAVYRSSVFGYGLVGLEHLDHRRLPGGDRAGAEADGRCRGHRAELRSGSTEQHGRNDVGGH